MIFPMRRVSTLSKPLQVDIISLILSVIQGAECLLNVTVSNGAWCQKGVLKQATGLRMDIKSNKKFFNFVMVL